jgi:hypothetical protein
VVAEVRERAASAVVAVTSENFRATAPAPALAPVRTGAATRVSHSRRRRRASARSTSGNSLTVCLRAASKPIASSTTRSAASAGLRVAGVGAHQRITAATTTVKPPYANAGSRMYGARARRIAVAQRVDPVSHAPITITSP